MRIKESGGIRRRQGRTLEQILAAGLLALMLTMGVGCIAYTPILLIMQNRSDVSNAASAILASSNYFGYLLGAILAAFVPGGRLQAGAEQPASGRSPPSQWSPWVWPADASRRARQHNQCATRKGVRS